MSTIKDVSPRRIDDWCTLTEAHVEIRQQGTTVGRGIVDAVTHDGRILWLYSPVEGRRLYEKADFYNAWATEECTGFHYKVSCSET
ncbi:hypothetical protein [Pseudarthrobacter phenanthrenivorans]|uniref:hypothetical protein n=1 Tax=Pseudarthrobacter phenanthrenivorans TaxID=361575 RepID=UPI002F351168